MSRRKLRPNTYHSPPQSVGERAILLVVVLLAQVDEEGGENKAQEADVECGQQLLSMRPDHGAWKTTGKWIYSKNIRS